MSLVKIEVDTSRVLSILVVCNLNASGELKIVVVNDVDCEKVCNNLAASVASTVCVVIAIGVDTWKSVSGLVEMNLFSIFSSLTKFIDKDVVEDIGSFNESVFKLKIFVVVPSSKFEIVVLSSIIGVILVVVGKKLIGIVESNIEFSILGDVCWVIFGVDSIISELTRKFDKVELE